MFQQKPAAKSLLVGYPQCLTEAETPKTLFAKPLILPQ